jgi:phage-related protein
MYVMTWATNWIKCSVASNPTTLSPYPPSVRVLKKLGYRDDTGTYRMIYTVRLADAVYVLHVFQKKTQNIGKYDIELARKRYTELMKDVQ